MQVIFMQVIFMQEIYLALSQQMNFSFQRRISDFKKK